MARRVPKLLREALDAGTWRNPGADALRKEFSCISNLDDLELFEDVATMEGVARHIDEGGYVDDEPFCMVRTRRDRKSFDDGRLVFEDALFIGGSIRPGDDVFVAVRLDGDEDPQVLVFDWNQPVPARWVPVGPLSRLVSGPM